MSEHLDELKKRLYKPGESFDARLERPELTPRPQKPPSEWVREPNVMQEEPKKSGGVWAWVIGIAVFVAVAGFGTYYYLNWNTVSDKNIVIDISSPENAVGGERITWEVQVKNENKKALLNAEIIFEYPDGSKVLDEGVKGFRARKTIGTIGAGEIVKISFSAFIYGFEEEVKNATANLEYSSEGSSSTFSKKETSQIRITKVPVGISFDVPQEIRAGQEVEIRLNYVSNADSDLENLLLQVELPSGYVAKSTEPKAEAGGRSWIIDKLEPGEKGAIILRGILNGEELEEKSFRATVGVRSDSGEFSPYGEGVITLQLHRPFLEIDAKISGQDNFIANTGDSVGVEITYKNNLKVPVKNLVIEGTLNVKGLDESRMIVKEGSYRSLDKKIIWNASTNPALKELDPGETGIVTVQLKYLDSLSVKTISDKEFNTLMHFEIRPGIEPPEYSGVDLTGEDDIQVKLASRLQLVRRGLYYSKTIANTGPLPPKVGQETTYAVVFSLTNSTNDLDGVKVKASLPPYVNWKNNFIPSSSSITFDSNTGEVVWNVGDIKAGVGYLTPAKEITFKIGFIPSIDQVGQAPELVKDIMAEGHDVYTDKNLSVNISPLTTRMEADPKIDIRLITVVK